MATDRGEQREQLERIKKLFKEPSKSLKGIGALKSLIQLDLRFQGLTEVPKEVCACVGLNKLDMGCNKLSALPEEMKNLTSLKILFLTSNEFKIVPPVLSKMKGLSMLSLMRNKLKKLDCTDLPQDMQWMIMTDNQISEVTSIGRLKKLQKCMFSHNNLHKFPEDVKECTSLQMLRLANNKFENVPTSVFKAPRISWIALSGNPCTRKLVEIAVSGKSTQVDYKTLSFGETLGEGSGGKVRVATWTTTEKKVAVKEYRGSRFSDGTARDEWMLNTALPPHPKILSALGSFSEPHLGLVLELMENATSVGGPPSLVTCTRDTPPRSGKLLSDVFALKVAKSICEAACHLHKYQIAHGDIYLHNTLTDAKGNIKLSDFGAGFVYPKNLQSMIEGTEVRSFGWLLDDLAKFTESKSQSSLITKGLQRLADSCTKDGEPSKAPNFGILLQEFEQLQKSVSKDTQQVPAVQSGKAA
ncbi:hypothetical protein AAMO2058_000798200 [Amorphochlora amoebiformis]